MHERPYWWRPEDHAGRGEWRGSPDRPYWWSEDDLPERRYEGRRARDYDDDRVQRDPRYADARYGDYEDDRRHRGDHRHRSWGRIAKDEVKSMFIGRRSDRRRHDEQLEAPESRRDERRDEREGRKDFRGVGPRMRHDEDEDVREEICQRLTDDPDLDASGILVRVIDNEAILDGAVRNKRDAERAHHLASDVPGVIFVRNRLRVGRTSDDRVRRATIGMGYDDSPSRRGRRWS